ncbi:hypothetical protein evm_002742 [Chilo suppressalis]|nr:hypothetical protein evm_002742 [Chilo suppressalis]
MEDSSKYQQMQDEMSRFEAEISGTELAVRPVIGAGTFGAVQQQLERAVPMMPPFEQAMAARMMFPTVPPPPPPPSMMVPASVQRLRPPGMPDCFPGPMPFLRPGLPGPQLIPPPPPKPQPVVLSAAPKLYKQPKEEEEKEKKDKDKESRKRKRSPPPPPVVRAEPAPEPAPLPAPPPPPVITPAADPAPPNKPKKEKKNRKVVRTAGGQVWEDVTLLDWPDDDFRMFCGDLGNDVTDELLTRTFSKYTSFQRAKVIRDKRTNKSKGFGFVSFKDPGDFSA